ncbi:transglycosylase SLT domain-containing protein [Bacillus altitudinis]|uniref:transglycosylase SLT domain-containing protein n=1 Tax=Bacillus altitudinis TaxID=293387 RepID=UPI003B518157
MNRRPPSKLGDALKNIGKGSGKLLKKVPILGSVLSATNLIGMKKENAGEKIGATGGGIAGGMAGAAAGAAIGSVVPGVGTAIGGLVGGIAGSMGGESIGETIGKWFDGGGFEKIGQKAIEIKDQIVEVWSSVADWFIENVWTPLSSTVGTVATTIWSSLVNAWTWIQETFSAVAGWFIENVWTPLSDTVITVATTIWSNLVNAWTWIQETFSAVAGWFIENVWTPLSDTVVTVATTIWSSLVNAWTWIQETFSAVAGWFIENVWTPLSSTVVTVATGIWTALSNAWKTIQSIFGAVSSWFMNNVWNPLVETVGTIKDSIGKKFEEAYKVVTDIWDGLSKWFKDNIQTPIVKVAGAISDGFSAAFGWVQKIFEKAGGIVDVVINWIVGKKKPDNNATGGYITQPTLSWIGEAGNEFVIPTQNNRGRGKMLLAQAASHLGMSVVPSSSGAASPVSSSPAPITPNAPAAPTASAGSIGGTVSMNGNIQSASIGEQFNHDFEQGLNQKVVSLDQWKQKNIQQPFNQMTSDSGKYGQQTVSAFATGQQMTPTGTDSFLQSRVKAPYQQVMTASPTWGSGTVSGFATGQNATSIGTSQYVDQHVKQPFLQAKQESPGWGSGMIDAFNSGMRSKASEVTQAAKEMAKKVEQAFREELDIHSPSRVMMSLGKFASIGVVKGLDSVDVKKFAENQAGSLIGAFSGMGASGLSVQQWLMAALMATGTSMSWLPGLMTIAQHESNGNPKAINLWDSNAKKGTPSKGLMQTIGPTFHSNKGKGMNDIWNPIHNAVAAINYIKGRYGTVFNTPGLRSMRRGGPYKGYANGGLITQEQVARVGEGNKREWIIPEERGIRGRYLLTQAAKALGMQVYDPSNASAPLPESQMQQVTSAQSAGTATTSGNKQITIQFNGDQHFHNGQDQQSLVEKIRQMLVDELEVELQTGTKGVVIDG